MNLGVEQIWWHDADIIRVIENVESNELGFEVMYPVDWENNRFEPRTIVFIDVLQYRVDDFPCVGTPQIIEVTQTGEEEGRGALRIQTNQGTRTLLCSRVEIRDTWGAV